MSRLPFSPKPRPPAMSFPVTLKFGLLRLMKQLFPDPASDGSPDHTGDRGTRRSCGGCWSGGRSSTTSPQGQVHVPAGCTQPPHHHLTHISIIHRCPHLCIATPHLIIFVAVNRKADTTPPSIPPSASTTLHKPFGGRNY